MRIDEHDLAELEYEASQNMITLNHLVNQIINNYLVWERHVRKMKFIPISDELLIEFLKDMDDKKIQKTSGIAYNAIKDVSLHVSNTFNFDSFLIAFKAYCSECGFHIGDKTDKYTKSIFVSHTLGKSFSPIIKQIFKLALDEFHIPYSCEQTSNTVLIHIETS